MKSLRPFIKSHIKTVLEQYDKTVVKQISDKNRHMPFDGFLREYFKSNKTLGPTERSIVSKALYSYMRNDLLFGYLSKDNSIEKKIKLLTEEHIIKEAISNPNIPQYINYFRMFISHIRCSTPKHLFDLVANQYGDVTTYDFFQNLNERAPLTVRCNPIKTNRDDLIQSWRNELDRDVIFRKTKFSPYGITFPSDRQMNLQSTTMFREGLFEIQDEASQICALRVECEPKQKVLDMCAGSGGKTLAFAHQMQVIIKILLNIFNYPQGTGQIILHDPRVSVIEKAKARCSRAGIQNIQLVTDLQKISNYRFDWILLDVPCTGLGTLRRNPDIKLFFTEHILKDLIQKQRKIFEQSLSYLKPDGKIVYVTCSFLKQENEDQIQYFCQQFNMMECNKAFKSLPESNQINMDSFFSATLMLA